VKARCSICNGENATEVCPTCNKTVCAECWMEDECISCVMEKDGTSGLNIPQEWEAMYNGAR